MHKTAKLSILAALAVVPAAWAASSLAENAPPHPPAASVPVEPPLADRTFPFLRLAPAWSATPARVSSALVPNAPIVCGHDEHPLVLASAGLVAYHLGQMVEAAGGGSAGSAAFPLLSDTEAQASDASHFIVIGTENDLARSAGVEFDGPGVKLAKLGDWTLLIAGGSTPEETAEAARYLGATRLAFKAGAYKTFFSFVRLRGLVERGEWTAALEAIESPSGLSACGRNMEIAAPMAANFPPPVKALVKRRDDILYRLLPEAVRAKDADSARSLWTEAMRACYACHQSAGEIPQLRRFRPDPLLHARHQDIAERYGLSEGGMVCGSCHEGPTEVRGYFDPEMFE